MQEGARLTGSETSSIHKPGSGRLPGPSIRWKESAVAEEQVVLVEECLGLLLGRSQPVGRIVAVHEH